MKILFFTNLLPYPLDNGGKINTYTKIMALKSGGHDVDLISFKETNTDCSQYENHLRNYCTNVYQIYHRLTTMENKIYMCWIAIHSLFSKYSFGVYKYKCKEMNKLLMRIAREKSYDCIYYDHLQMYYYEPIAKKLWPNAEEIIDEHNCETIIMKRNAVITKNILKRCFLLIEARKLERFENMAIKKADKIIILSEEDEKALKLQMGGKDFNYVIIPNRIVETNKIKSSNEQMSKKLRILFIGTMTWAPNNDGVIWFIENVYKQILMVDQNIELYIVGKNPSSRLVELSKTMENITVTGYVESVDLYYELCDLMIVPLFVGSGQRIKIIEAFSRKMPVVSTSIGAEGLIFEDGRSIIIANNVSEFVEAILRLRNTELRKFIANEARKKYDKFYSTEAISFRFNQIFER